MLYSVSKLRPHDRGVSREWKRAIQTNDHPDQPACCLRFLANNQTFNCSGLGRRRASLPGRCGLQMEVELTVVPTGR